MSNYEENYVLRIQPRGDKYIFKTKDELFNYIMKTKDTIFNCGFQRNTITIEPVEVKK